MFENYKHVNCARKTEVINDDDLSDEADQKTAYYYLHVPVVALR